MQVQELNVGSCCKTYLIACKVTGKALLIDPVKDYIDRYLALLAYKGLTLDAVVDTHTHADHSTAAFLANDLTGVRIIMARKSPVPRVTEHVDDGDVVQIGNLGLNIFTTPGHTPDSISLYDNEYVFTGDCLLIGGTGRTDFAGGDSGEQYDSITGKLFTLPDATIMLPAHDYRGNTSSTIGAEKTGNPRVAGRTRQQYIELMDSLEFPLPGKIQEVLQPNQTAIEDDRTKFPDLAQLNAVHQIDVDTVHARIQAGDAPVLLDVREVDEFNGELGHIAGSMLVPLKGLSERAGKLRRDREIMCICRAGVRSTTAAAILKGLGFEHISNMKDGMLEWNDRGYPVERST
jgi:glyoxylase-like metal-dependent hydrolase (beta-lactamase superfamily II)/rhodanese-related sulfurtransferase